MKYDVLRVEASSVDLGIKKLRSQIARAKKNGWKEYNEMQIFFFKNDCNISPIYMLSQIMIKK